MDDNHDTIKPRYVKILTYSQAALKLLNIINFKSTIALKTAEALENLKWRVKGCTLARVKAQVGIVANKAADKVAKLGARIKREVRNNSKNPSTGSSNKNGN